MISEVREFGKTKHDVEGILNFVHGDRLSSVPKYEPKHGHVKQTSYLRARYLFGGRFLKFFLRTLIQDKPISMVKVLLIR